MMTKSKPKQFESDTDKHIRQSFERYERKTSKSSKRFVLRKRKDGYVVFDRQQGHAISHPIVNHREAQKFCDKFVGFLPET